MSSEPILDFHDVLNVRDLQVRFSPVGEPVVNQVNFRLQRGQILGIVGESGSGKSVTSLAIMGLIPSPGKITEGEIWFRPSPKTRNGEPATENYAEPVNLLQLSEDKRRTYRGGQMAMIFQEPMSSLNPVYTVGFQITEAIRQHNRRISKQEAWEQAIALLERVKLLRGEDTEPYKQSMMKRYPHELSGGQLQRVMIAIAISCNPTILIADEPSTALDVTVQAGILDLLRELCRQQNMSMIFITHDFGVIAEIADAVVVMREGEIVEQGNIRQILENPQEPYTKGLLACRPQLDQKLTFLPTVDEFLNHSEAIPEPSTSLVDSQDASFKSELLLTVKDLRVGFPKRGMLGQTQDYFMAVDGVSFKLKRGETLGLVGESGCGKSTLARSLLRLVQPLTGKIWFRKEPDKRLSDPSNDITHLGGESLRKLRRQMQIIFQNPYNSLNPRLTIGRAIMEPMIIHRYLNNQRDRTAKVADLLRQVGLNPDWMNRYPHELSGGQRQRVCIARALALNPQLIICDESVSALDVSVQAQVLNLLKKLQQQFGLTYIFISHDLSVVKFMSDRILVMNQGKIEERGLSEKILNKPREVYTKQLIRSIPTGKLTINIGAIPAQDPEKLEQRYKQLSTYLEAELDLSVKYKPVTDYRLAVSAFSSGVVDIICLGGLTAIQARLQVPEAEAIIQRDIDTQFCSVFIANKKSKLEPIQDIDGLKVLRGRKFIFGNELSTSGCLMPQYYLKQAGVSPEDFANVGYSVAHDTTIKLVKTGIYEIGAVSGLVWQKWVEADAFELEQVQVIWRTPVYINSQWLIHPSLKKRYGEQFTKQIQAAFLKLNRDESEHQNILKALGANRFIPVDNSKYEEIVRELRTRDRDSFNNSNRQLLEVVPQFLEKMSSRNGHTAYCP